MSRRGPGTPLELPRTKDGRAILSRADLDAYDDAPSRAAVRTRYYCPIHGGDHQRSLSVDPDTGTFKCHTCGERGTLREHWLDGGGGGGTVNRTPAPSIEEIGRRALLHRADSDAARAARFAAEIPPSAAAFLAHLDAMSAALRDPACPGAVYLRARGLNPVYAATLGVGYAPPNRWPGDRYENDGRGLRNGRIVYPLYDPCTGRVVSAVARLCLDASPSWSAPVRDEFKGIKQRKLKGCPAGVWPYASIAAARERHGVLVLVEGPADALALAQSEGLTYPVLGLLGTANVLTTPSIRGIVGVVLALDDDASGQLATRTTRIDFILAGVHVEVPARGWLDGANDPADLVARDDGHRRAAAVDALMQACQRVRASAWDAERADGVLRALYERLNNATADRSGPLPPFDGDAIDTAYEARDWHAFIRTLEECETMFMAALTHT